jgi:hypothetical protein
MALFDNNPLQSLYAPVQSGLGNLFDGMSVFGTSIPSGILDTAQEDKLRKQALLQGLLGTAATYLATPKNLNTGSALPYLGKAFLGGMGASQDVIDRGLNNAYRQKLLAGKEDNIRTYEKDRQKITEQFDPKTKTWTPLGISPVDAPKDADSFGTGVEGSSLNLLARGSQNTPEGEAIRKTTKYALAFRNQTTPKYVDQVRMDENGNEYYVRVQLPAAKLPPNILEPIYGEEGVTTQPVDMTQPQITTKPGQVTQPTQPTQTNTTVPPNIKKFGQTKQDIFKQEQDLRKQYQDTPEVKNFGDVRSAYNIINKSLNNASPAGDLAGATKFMKLLDPTSVVRDTELRLAMEATGVVDRAQNYFNMLATGQKLNPTQRQDFLNVANKLYQAAEEVKNKYDVQYAEIAKTNKLDPSKVIMGYKEKTPSSQVRNKADILKEYGVE